MGEVRRRAVAHHHGRRIHAAICEPFVIGQQSLGKRSVKDPLPTIATTAIALCQPFVIRWSTATAADPIHGRTLPTITTAKGGLVMWSFRRSTTHGQERCP